ncbi:hypothetical protein SCA6_015168 [Theobroma cacao]
MMNPRADKLVRRTTMVATATASYFLLTADYGPEPNVLDPVPEPVTNAPFIRKKRTLYVSIKKAILSAQSSLKEFILGSRKEHQESSVSSSNAKEHP